MLSSRLIQIFFTIPTLLTLRRTSLQPWVRALIATQLVAGVILGARHYGLFQRLELASHDAMIRIDAATTRLDAIPSIALVVATEQDVQTFGWPLADGLLARLLERLESLGAGPVGVDIFRDHAVAPGSEVLEALLRERDGVLWVRGLRNSDGESIDAPAALAGTRRAVLADLVTDPGGVVRRGLLAAEDPETGTTVLSLGAALAERAPGGGKLRSGDVGGLTINNREVPLVGASFGPYSYVDAAGYQMMLDFREPRGAFPRFGIAEALQSQTAAAALRGRAVVIGVDTVSVRDNHATPLSLGWGDEAPLSGAELHARTASQLIRISQGERRAALRPALPVIGEIALVWMFANLGGSLILIFCSTVAAFVILPTILITTVIACTVAFTIEGLLIPIASMLSALVISLVFSALVLYSLNLSERRRLRWAFEHYLDPRIIKELIESGGAGLSLVGIQRDVTAMFTDISGFTAISESMTPANVATLLNEYFEGLCAAVVAHGGLVENFMGDGMVALFGAPLEQPDHADRAVDAALAIDAFATQFREKRLQYGGIGGCSIGLTRIGLHSGLVMVGNLGTRTRMHYSAVGDVMNVASRLEGLNAQLGTRICASAETAGRSKRHKFLFIGEHPVKGRIGTVSVVVPEQQASLLGVRPRSLTAVIPSNLWPPA